MAASFGGHVFAYIHHQNNSETEQQSNTIRRHCHQPNKGITSFSSLAVHQPRRAQNSTCTMADQIRFRNVLEYKHMGRNARGDLVYQVVRLPKRLVREMELGKKERCRIKGTLDGREISLALNPDPESTHYLMVSKALMKSIKKDIGDEVEVVFQKQDPNDVDVPAELTLALRGKALKVWDDLTAGKQRIWTTYVDKAKMQATRTKRVKEVIARLKSGNLDPKQPLK